ncbi:MAG: hypothetical protein U0354_00400 [Candidatus Sericytochromatia bacterium]
MKNLKYIILLSSVFLFYITTYKAYSNERYVLKDRDIKTVGILPFTFKDSKISSKVRIKFLNILSDNLSGIKFINLEEINKNVDCVLSGDIKEYTSEIKSNTIADAYNYDILEQQVKISINIEIRDTENNDLIWRRQSSKYSTQSWLDFVRSRIGDNNVVDYFFVPNQLSTGLKKQYNDEDFIDKTINDVVKDLSFNLVKIK